MIEKTPLTADEVCGILRACGESQVTVLQFRDLYVRRDAVVPKSAELPQAQPTSDTEISEIQQRISQESLERDELAVRESQIEDLVLTNPVEFERLLAEGRLDDEVSDDGDEETHDF